MVHVRNRSIRSYALTTVLTLAAVWSVAPATQADTGIHIVMNQARILKLARPADTVVVGDPEIADAVVKDSRTVVLTGKGFGITNIVIIDADGAAIVDDQVMVSRSVANTTRVYRRAYVQTLSCTPYCETAQKTEAEKASDSQIGGAN
ncbi:pilus assembly protein N-terminal domain-containing protein [Phyllobacterium zundukense]|jgi:Flp pilus assembly secretin CpaC|uniref:Pilus assembly protein N-terminal domain-containing protein n=1 Tax=Phyllobacterium zundukense TaxID=1867719 RepID=A0ACD4D5U6_9HYPH|nr:pilus assembly protein N-terminal domain-containing protein [Phyllobacterium zundukense]UXN61311.1 pilus assembly protein N-terminal domain-containing protein [Phyllobacterium zundukense]